MSDDMHETFDDESLVDGLLEAQMPRKELPDRQREAHGRRGGGRSVLHGRGSRRRRPRQPRSEGTRSRPDAVAAAKANFSDVTLNRIAEVGPQALEPKNFSGPLWNKLTGGTIKVTEAPFADIRTKAIAEHLAKSGALDVIDVSPAWIPEFADRGVIIPIDDLVAKYKAKATFNDLHPLYRLLGKYKGKTWGFFDDGDVWNLYYRKDIFANPKLRRAYKAKFKRDLRPPRTWDGVRPRRRSSSPTSSRRRSTAGGEGRALGNPGNQFYFFQVFRNFGGQFFDPKTMKAQINNAIGVKAMTSIMKEVKASPPGRREARLRLVVGPLAATARRRCSTRGRRPVASPRTTHSGTRRSPSCPSRRSSARSATR